MSCVHSVSLLIENFKQHLMKYLLSCVRLQILPNEISIREWIVKVSHNLLPLHYDRFILYLSQYLINRINQYTSFMLDEKIANFTRIVAI